MSGVSPGERCVDCVFESNANSSAQNESDLFKYLEENYADIVEFTEDYTFVDDRVVAYFFTGIFIIGVCANLVVIIVVGLDPQVRSKSSLLYAFNLALADCTMLLFLPFNIYRTLHKDWIFGDVACWLNNSVLFVNMFVSIFMLMCMALDRYLAVIRGSWSSRLNKFRDSQLVINTTCVVIWCLGILLAMPLYMRSQHISKNGKAECGINWCTDSTNDSTAFDDLSYVEKREKLNTCFDIDDIDDIEHLTIDPALNDGSNSTCSNNPTFNLAHVFRCQCGVPKRERLYYFHTFTWAYMLPLAAIVYSYASIAAVIWKSEHRVHRGVIISGERRLNSRLRSNLKTRRLMTLIIALILAYVICWTPWHLFHILTAFNVRIQFETCNSFFHVYNCMIWFNSALNPILYSFLGHGFKLKLYEAVNKMKRILPSTRAFIKEAARRGTDLVRRKTLSHRSKTPNRREAATGASSSCGGMSRSPAMNVDSINDDSFIQNSNLLGLAANSTDEKSVSVQSITSA